MNALEFGSDACRSREARTQLITRVSAFIAVFTALSSSVRADEGMTYATSVAPTFLEGQLRGCSIVFDVVRNDPEYSQNEPVQASGSLTVFAFEGAAPSVGLKLGVSPVGGQSAGKAEGPSSAYLVHGLASNINDSAGPSRASDLAGYQLFAFRLNDATAEAMSPAIETGKFKVGYTMRGGSTAAVFTVDVGVADTKDGKPVPSATNLETWRQCVSTLLASDASDDVVSAAAAAAAEAAGAPRKPTRK